jgi:hypothetical protein
MTAVVAHSGADLGVIKMSCLANVGWKSNVT